VSYLKKEKGGGELLQQGFAGKKNRTHVHEKKRKRICGRKKADPGERFPWGKGGVFRNPKGGGKMQLKKSKISCEKACIQEREGVCREKMGRGEVHEREVKENRGSMF